MNTFSINIDGSVCGWLLANQTMQQGEHLPPLNVFNISITILSGHQVGGTYLAVCHLIILVRHV